MPKIASSGKKPDDRPARKRYRDSQRGYKKHEHNILSLYEILKKKYPGKYKLIKREVICNRAQDKRNVYQIIRTDRTYKEDSRGVKVRVREK